MCAKKQAEETLVLALASGATVKEAARVCGSDERAVRRKLVDAKFRKQVVVAARAALTEQMCGLLTEAGLEAAKALMELTRADEPPAVLLAAAWTVLDVSMKLRQVVDLEARWPTWNAGWTSRRTAPPTAHFDTAHPDGCRVSTRRAVRMSLLDHFHSPPDGR